MTTEPQPAPRRYAAVIVAAGRGARAGAHADGPKQYRMIGGAPVLAHTLRLFLDDPRFEQVIVVTHPEDDALLTRALGFVADAARLVRVHGEAMRQASVLNGLRAVDAAVTHVIIHDGVRPFASRTLIDRIDAGFAAGAAALLPAVAIADTIKRVAPDGRIGETVPRDGLYAAQTPQAFERAAILKVHEEAAATGRTDFTDDAALAEAGGMDVRYVEGEAGNVKLTVPEDLAMAERRLSALALPDVRTGNGYDVHQLVPGTGVTLCGIFIAHDQALSGHSDADVGLHALTDALLATCGAGDIGDHFPPSEAKWKGAPSRIFVEHAARIVRQASGTIMNADVSLIAEAPRIGPHRTAMRAALAEILGISVDRCSVKATTNESIGFVGRREGIAAIATATVVYGGGTL
ncbi:MAG: bifunctional 2-C-methyl-D-erythritol 4-phosphate cytidylyltransferase/2-C-methyl-D-erythritol 2,4-cyclodiphosphate synthase [Pararhizobium sp.]